MKWAYQRVFRGYDDRIFWGFDGYFADVFVPALKTFCQNELSDEARMELNVSRKKVYQETLDLIDALKDETYEDMFNGVGIQRLSRHFADHIGYYWN